MPVVRLYASRLEELLGERLGMEELEELLFSLKGELEAYDRVRGVIEVEVTVDRPDLLISEGLARAVKGLLGIELGSPRLSVFHSDITMSVRRVPTRPYVALGVVSGYELDERSLEELIQFQEKLHATLGRKRRKVAIGLHDLDKLPHGVLEYRLVSLDNEMTPLGSASRTTVRDVLRRTPQGELYGAISLSAEGHPAILAGGEVISLPPVVNSEVTRLEPGTRNLLVDVTGTDRLTVLKTLDLITSVLSERRGARVGLCRLVEGEANYVTPGLTPTVIETSLSYVSRALGLAISGEEVERLGGMARWDVVVSDERVVASAPEYRLDILHPVDLVEDVAMAYGYNRVPERPRSPAPFARESPLSRFRRLVRRVLVGLGFVEAKTFTMVSERLANAKPEEGVRPVRILNPVSAEMTCLRPSLIPSLLSLASESQKASLPIKVFELGYYAFVGKDGLLESGEKVALVVVGYSISYEDVQSQVHGLLQTLGMRPRYARRDSRLFIRGRSAAVLVEGCEVGFVGEVNPDLLLDLGLKHTAGAAELYLGKLFTQWRRSSEAP